MPTRPCLRMQILWTGVLLAAGAGAVSGGDWPTWCGQPSRNMSATSDRRLPDWADCGVENNAGEVDLESTKNIKWAAEVGHPTTGSPVVSRGRVFIGTTWEDGKDACFLCFDEETGRRLGSFICPKPRRENLERWAISSTPTIEDDRLYFVSPYQEAMCLDLKILLGGRDQGEGEDRPQSAKADKAAVERISSKSIVWRYDMLDKLKAYYHHTASSSVLVHGEYVYVCTGNGRSWVPGRIPYSPLTPSLVAFNKTTGQLVARDDEQIGEQLYRGQYTSPALGLVNGQAQILFATGNGVCYAFEPVDPAAPVAPDRWMTTSLRGPIVYFIDVEGKQTGGLSAAEYARSFDLLANQPKPALPLELRFSWRVPATTPIDSIPTATVPDVPLLKKVWWCDCIPPEYKKVEFYPRQIKGDGRGRPCDIIGTPVFCNNRVYVAIGGDPNHGGRDSKGSLVCIDATKTGDVTQTGKIWSYNGLNQSVSTVAVADGLVLAVDAAYTLHCLDAESGHCHWTYSPRKGATCFSSPLVADGKVYIGKTVLSASKTFELRDGIKNDQNTVYSSHCVANGVLFAVIGERLWAICHQADKKTAGAAPPAAATSPPPALEPAGGVRAAPAAGGREPSIEAIKKNWPNLRGPFGQAVAYNVAPPADFDAAAGRNLLWKAPIPRLGASSPVVWEGRVFLTGADESAREVYCFDAASGRLLWRQAAKQPAEMPEVSEDIGHAASTGATDGKLFFAIFSTGDLVAVDMNGSIAWTRSFGIPKCDYGYASSLIAYKHLFVQIDDKNGANLYALDPVTGKTVWRKTRTLRQSWASPIIAISGGREMVVLAENPTAAAYDVSTGEAVLSVKCLSGEVAPSPAYARGTIVVANERARVSAISLASGTIAWSGEDDLPNVASPLATEDFVVTGDASGMVNCYDIGTGRKLWTHEFDESFYPSPILAAGRIYAMDNAGTMHVFQASKTFVAVADARLGEESLATPAFAGGRIFIRGRQNLYCIGAKGP
ncbi:MAG: PQQ-binding-like beta-propeller repeat protein [Thermoguttaceae bacterium]|jgi:outer membrane protein assembly factor BamB